MTQWCHNGVCLGVCVCVCLFEGNVLKAVRYKYRISGSMSCPAGTNLLSYHQRLSLVLERCH